MHAITLFIALFISSNSASAQDADCVNYNAKKHAEYASEITITGRLRSNRMLERLEIISTEMQSVSIVLVTAQPLYVQGGETNNPIACAVSEFTLHLTPQQLVHFQEALTAGKEITVTGKVGMAESSIEEYDNATLTNIR